MLQLPLNASDSCQICLHPIDDPPNERIVGHLYRNHRETVHKLHEACAKRWYADHNKCPTCDCLVPDINKIYSWEEWTFKALKTMAAASFEGVKDISYWSVFTVPFFSGLNLNVRQIMAINGLMLSMSEMSCFDSSAILAASAQAYTILAVYPKHFFNFIQSFDNPSLQKMVTKKLFSDFTSIETLTSFVHLMVIGGAAYGLGKTIKPKLSERSQRIAMIGSQIAQTILSGALSVGFINGALIGLARLSGVIRY